jgi:hypothetical protein
MCIRSYARTFVGFATKYLTKYYAFLNHLMSSTMDAKPHAAMINA